MRKLRFYILFLCAILIHSCTTSKMLTSTIKPNEVSDIQKFEPLSFISLIEKGNRAKYNDSLSQKSKALLYDAIDTFKQMIPFTGDIFISDTSCNRKLKKEILFLLNSANKQQMISTIKIPPILDSILESKGKRFGLITVASGFTRTDGNYGGQLAKGLGIGLLTLGMYVQTPVKSKSNIYIMIVDAKENNIAFFRKSILKEEEPLDRSVLKKQIQKIFEGYFWDKNKISL